MNSLLQQFQMMRAAFSSQNEWDNTPIEYRYDIISKVLDRTCDLDMIEVWCSARECVVANSDGRLHDGWDWSYNDMLKLFDIIPRFIELRALV